MKDVASQAGVSAATVSRVLSGGRHVDPATRLRVLQAAKALDYHPDHVARSLRRRRTNLIGLIVSTIENAFFSQVARAAEETALQSGYNLIICNSQESAEREEAYLEVLGRLLVAGVILAPAPGDARHLRRLVSAGTPLVLINRRVRDLPCSSVTCDDEEAAFSCVSHLISEGRRRIAAITGLHGTSTTEERLAGYRRALRTAGLALDPALEVCGHATLEGGRQAALSVLRQRPRPDALFVFNNVMIQGAVTAMQDLGLRWPEDVDVAGFGAFTTASLYQPPLTLISQPTNEIGTLSVQLLVAQVEGTSPREPQQVILRNRLVPREAWTQQLRPTAPSG
jgi:LacI family transcriptional regulator